MLESTGAVPCRSGLREASGRLQRVFGHGGAGGSSGWADPEHGIGMGYTMNRMWSGGFMRPDPRAQSLANAVYNSLGISLEQRRGG